MQLSEAAMRQSHSRPVLHDQFDDSIATAAAPTVRSSLCWKVGRPFIQLTGERGGPQVVEEGKSRSMGTVRVPLVPPDDCSNDHRWSLRQLMDHEVPMLTVQGPSGGI